MSSSSRRCVRKLAPDDSPDESECGRVSTPLQQVAIHGVEHRAERFVGKSGRLPFSAMRIPFPLHRRALDLRIRRRFVSWMTRSMVAREYGLPPSSNERISAPSGPVCGQQNGKGETLPSPMSETGGLSEELLPGHEVEGHHRSSGTPGPFSHAHLTDGFRRCLSRPPEDQMLRGVPDVRMRLAVLPPMTRKLSLCAVIEVVGVLQLENLAPRTKWRRCGR